MSADLTSTPTLSPGEELTALVAGAAALFYWAEKDDNPAVKGYWDALHYVSSSLSVGYCNFFPVTPIGKLVASVLMTVGPALAARGPEGNAAEEAMEGKMDEVIAELRLLNARLAGKEPAA